MPERVPLEVAGVASGVEVQLAGLFSRPRILVDGEPAPTVGRNKYRVRLPRADGGDVEARLHFDLLSTAPTVFIDGEPHALGEKLSLAWVILALLPGVLVVGGALGGICGALGFGFNLALVRSPTLDPLEKVFGVLFASLVSLTLWLAIGALPELLWL